jgi:hypothetical protein
MGGERLTAKPLLISIGEACFQLSLLPEEVATLIENGDIATVQVCQRTLVVYESLKTFIGRRKTYGTKA